MKIKNELPTEVATRYTCTQEPTRVILPQCAFREIDLRELTLEEADWLYETGLNILVPLESKPAKKKGTEQE